MAAFVRVKFPNGNEASVPESFAKSRGLKVLTKPATKSGRVLRDKPKVNLRGEKLDAALDSADLPKSGTAEEKRERLAEHKASGEQP